MIKVEEIKIRPLIRRVRIVIPIGDNYLTFEIPVSLEELKLAIEKVEEVHNGG